MVFKAEDIEFIGLSKKITIEIIAKIINLAFNF